MRGRGKEDQRGGGLDLWVLGSHVVNLMHFFGGPAKSCSATIWEGDRLATKEDIKQGPEGTGPLVGDRLHARYELADGTIAYFDSIKAAGVREANFGLQIIGSKGIVDLRVDVEPLAHFVPGNPFLPTKEPRPWIPITSGGLDKPEPVAGIKAGVAGHLIPARDLMAAIQENRPTLCSAEDGRVTVEMICGVFASHLQNSKAVPLPLQVREHPLSSP
jgi:predicted dehydrogenase